MMERLDVDEIAARLESLLPLGLAEAHKDLSGNFSDVLAHGLRRLGLVTREEFDVQSRLLERTRARVDFLEKRLAELEVVTEGETAMDGGLSSLGSNTPV